MKGVGQYAVAYDVSDDRERRRVDKILKGYGFRVQKSVFECQLTRGDRKRMIDNVTKLALKTGSVRIYRIYGGADPVSIGIGIPDIDAEFAYVI